MGRVRLEGSAQAYIYMDPIYIYSSSPLPLVFTHFHRIAANRSESSSNLTAPTAIRSTKKWWKRHTKVDNFALRA